MCVRLDAKGIALSFRLCLLELAVVSAFSIKNFGHLQAKTFRQPVYYIYTYGQINK